MPSADQIDARGPRFGQSLTGTLSLVAFLADLPILVAALAVVLGAGSLLGSRFNLWGQLYRRLVQPRLDPPGELEHPAPPRFAMGLGFLFLSAAAILLLVNVGPPIVAWGLVLMVSALALFAAASGICLGCEIYLLLQRVAGRSTSSQRG